MLTYWDTEKVYFDGDQYFEQLLADIDLAKQYITIEMYMFNDDKLGRKVAEHLVSARARGVKVQMIVDGVGSSNFSEGLLAYFLLHKIVVKIYNPLPFFHPLYGKHSFFHKLRIFRVRLWRINKRNHRKIITIDNNIMYTGSFNITAEHTSLYNGKPWKDVGARVTGNHVKFTILNFKRLWKLRDYYRFKKQNKAPQLNWRQAPLRLNQTLYMRRFFQKDFMRQLDLAQSKIWVATPYFIPAGKLIRKLGKAAKRGVDVRILISRDTDVVIFKTLQYFYYGYLLKKGVKIYHYTQSVLHEKNYIIDEWITIGSTNLNHRSFLHDLEVDTSRR